MTALPEEAILFVLAQIAVLFAGFGGVSIVLGRLRTPVELARLRNVIITAFLLLLFSLFPVFLNQFGFAPEVSWRMGTGVLAVMTIGFYATSGDLKLFRDATRADKALMIGDGVLLLLLLAATSMPAPGLAAKVYLTALFWHLVSACVMFVMVFSPVWHDADMGSDDR